MLAVALAAALALTQGQAWDDDDEHYDDEEERPARVFVTAFGGGVFQPGEDRQDPAFGGEVAYAFDALEVGLYGAGYRLREGDSEWSPLVLGRVIQRFPTGRGLDAMFLLGIGAARREDWDLWFQVGLGFRLYVGPAFLTSEISFEQNDLIRLVGGLGVRF